MGKGHSSVDLWNNFENDWILNLILVYLEGGEKEGIWSIQSGLSKGCITWAYYIAVLQVQLK